MIQDVLFYSILLWVVLCIIQLIRRPAVSLKLILVLLMLNAFLAVSLWFFYYIFGFLMGFETIGHSQ